MSGTTTKVLAGCAVGCLLVLLAVGGVGWMGYRYARRAVEVVDAAERAEDRLVAEYGPAEAFTPPVQLTGDRVEVFLGVRELTQLQRSALADSVEGFAPVSGDSGVVSGLRAARAGVGMAPRMLEFARARNEALLEVGMGIGEYTWIYWLLYHAWLGHPADDSLLTDIMEARSETDTSMHMEIDGMDRDELKRHVRRQIEAMFANLEGSLAADPENSELSGLVSAELAAMEADSDRRPWQDGLPNAFAAGLEPYRDRLEASYSRATNPFELLELDSGPHGVTLE
jgi:hypothetical protein